MKFKIGDTVRVIKSGRSISSQKLMGKTGKVTRTNNEYSKLDIEDTVEGYTGGVWNDEIERIEMKTLRERIEALNNGWDNEANGILHELWEETAHKIDGRYHYCLTISPVTNGICAIYITGGNIGSDGNWGKIIKEFRHKDTACSKNRAFKQALLWLLEQSGLDTPQVGQEVKAEIEGKVYKVKILEKVS